MNRPRATTSDRSVLQRQDAGDVRGGQLADRVAHHEIGTHTPGFEQPEQRDLDREQRRLREFGGVQQVFVVTPHHVAQRPQQVPVQFAHHRVERLGEHRIRGVQSHSHAEQLGTLAGEDEHRLARRLARARESTEHRLRRRPPRRARPATPRGRRRATTARCSKVDRPANDHPTSATSSSGCAPTCSANRAA